MGLIGRILNRDIHRRIDAMEKRLASAIAQINSSFDDHLLSINENTNELQSNYEQIMETEQKIEKLAERLDEVSLFLNMGQRFKQKKYDLLPLTQNERELSLLLYYMTERGPVHVNDICKRTGLDSQGVLNYLNNLVKKGIPVQKNFYGPDLYLSLENQFRKVQAEENILEANEIVAKRLR